MERIRYIRSNREIASEVFGNLLFIDPDGTLPHRGLKIEEGS